MTAETDLPINDAVPAPTKIEPGNQFLWNWRQMQVYAQACVAHATAPLQAEVEALRAEVERLDRILGRIVEGDGDSTVGIRWGTDAFAAAREYLRAAALREQEAGRG